jgi:hypothetical protein
MVTIADVVETKITPAVTSTLRRGARKVQPKRQSRMRSMMSWRGLIALVAALGAAGAAAGFTMRKRYSSATAEAEKASSDAATSVPVQGGDPATDDSRVSSGW